LRLIPVRHLILSALLLVVSGQSAAGPTDADAATEQPPSVVDANTQRPDFTLRVAVISDLNARYGSSDYGKAVDDAIQRLLQLKPDLVLCTGDMIAGQRPQPLLQRQQLQAMWQAFHRKVSDPLAKAGIPLLVTPGNHDASIYPKFQLERTLFAEQWGPRKPKLDFVDDAQYPFRYAFAQDQVLFIALDVTRPGQLDAQQRTWLKRLLQTKGKDYRHRVAFSHLPIWPFTQQREREISADTRLEQLLKAHGVETYLSGHHHGFFPGFREGIRHIGQACLGSGSRRLIGQKQASPRGFSLLRFGPGRWHVSNLLAPDFLQSMQPDALPEALSSPGATLIRLDRVRPNEFGDGPEVQTRSSGPTPPVTRDGVGR
jgi:hypothetical protein